MRIQPFRGYRYAGGPGGRGAGVDLTSIVAPPYDQIDPVLQARLLAASPHNVVRITLPREEGGGNRYAGARGVLNGWLGEGVFRADEAPAIYPYEQTYALDGAAVTRTGFVALGEVSAYAEGVVQPHERTHAGPRADRLRLLEATEADHGLLFMLVRDPTGDLRRATAPAGAPVAHARDVGGALHRLWRLTDPAALERVAALMAETPVIIADGHHRYETAVEYAGRHPAARWKLMFFCALEAPGLTILPNHRLVHGVAGDALAALAQAAAPGFEVAPLADPSVFQPSNERLGVVTRSGAWVFRLREDARLAWPPGTSAAWRRLAVSILHEGLLRPVLGITDVHLDAATHVDYTPDRAEAIRQVREGRQQAAFLIAPTTPAELLAVVEGGELMPQKSTHFYPKLLDGLVFHRLAGAGDGNGSEVP